MNLKQLKLQEQQFLTKHAELRLCHALKAFSPSNCFPVRIYRDGSRWVCVFECDPDPMKCCIAYGDCPKQAMDNFDAFWNGAGTDIDLEEDVEEF